MRDDFDNGRGGVGISLDVDGDKRISAANGEGDGGEDHDKGIRDGPIDQLADHAGPPMGEHGIVQPRRSENRPIPPRRAASMAL